MAPLQTQPSMTSPSVVGADTADAVNNAEVLGANEIIGVPDTLENLTSIQQFYKDKTVFLTGATGFLGKIIMEKLLRCCDVRTIYILVRSKKGKAIETRCEEIFDDIVFDRVKRCAPKFRHKIVPVCGDCVLPGLGIEAAERRTLQQQVNIVFHVAATVRFDEKLRLALGINVAGTREIMLLAREMSELQALVHVSTAYANCNRPMTIDEQIYRPYLSGENAIKLTQCLDDKSLDAITPQLIKEWPNTYSFTKCLAEDLVRDMSKGMPVTVFRPAIVIPTLKEPVPGWIDNMYGPTGIVIGVGTGLLRVLYAKEANLANIVPVDMCVNSLLAAAWDVAVQSYDEPPVYNYVTSVRNPITWRDYCKLSIKHGQKMPLTKSIWHHSFRMSSSRLVVWLMTFFFHIVPAMAMDTGLLLSGRKPKILQVYKKIHKFCDIIGYFATNEWHFSNDNVQRLWQRLDEGDKRIFFFNMDDINWDEFLKDGIYGLRTYLMKDDPSTIPSALKRAQRMKVLHYVTLLVTYSILAYALFSMWTRIVG